MYGSKQKYSIFNTLTDIKDAIFLYDGNIPFACGFRKYDNNMAELKRVYVNKEYRGNGYSTYIVKQLLDRAKAKGYDAMLLETGIKQPEAISLYKKLGFQIMDHNGQYIGDSNSGYRKIEL